MSRTKDCYNKNEPKNVRPHIALGVDTNKKMWLQG